MAWASRRQRFVRGGDYCLEDRVLMSAFGHEESRAPVPAPVGVEAHLRHAEVETIAIRAKSAARAANRSSVHRASARVSPTVARWSWLVNTYWFVPVRNLPAVLYNSTTGTLQSVRDQTVYHIEAYRLGYFWGEAVTQLNSGSPSESTMVGSVTPQGRVLLTFTQTSKNSSPSITEGYGEMQRKSGQWTMENQMFTAPSETLQIGHWAYMVQTRPGMASWKSLPSVGESVPAFLNQGASS
jgi:hypothetical protein